MLVINEGKRRRKFAVTKDKRILFKLTQTLSIAFIFGWLLKKGKKSHCLKS